MATWGGGEESAASAAAASAAGLGRRKRARPRIGMPLPPPPIIQLRPRLLPPTTVVASPPGRNLYRKLCQQRYYVVAVLLFGEADISIPREGEGRKGEL